MCDVTAAVLSPLLAAWIREWFETPFLLSFDFLIYAFASAAATLLFMWSFDANRVAWRFFAARDAAPAVRAVLLGVAVGAIVGFSRDRLDSVARSVPFLQAGFQIGFYVMLRVLAREYFASESPRQKARKGVLVVGVNATAEIYVRALDTLSRGQLAVAGVLSDDPSMIGHTLRGHRVIATIANIEEAIKTLKTHGIDVARVVIAASPAELPGRLGERVREVADAFGLSTTDIHSLFGEAASPGGASEASDLEAIYLSGGYWLVKRALDFAAAVFLIALLAPWILVSAVVVLFDVGRPIIFWQQRWGRHGRPFTVYKFRSMKGPLAADGRVLADEERTSSIGRFMRRTRLDELPQLFNILRGDMSFVGPRPLLPVDQPTEIATRLAVRPGLTGWAQVNGGKLVGPEDKRALDLWYVGNASLWLDVRIAMMTISMFLRGDVLDTGAIARARQWLTQREAAIDVAEDASREALANAASEDDASAGAMISSAAR